MRRITFPLYVGGFLGPFGGAMLVALIPNVADGLDTSLGYVAAAITAYMVPFAVLQLVSGTLAERIGPRRVVRGGYIGFGLAALACALAPEIWSFLAARAAMGAANAFLSPILLAALSEVAAPGVLGRTVGTFAAAQTAGLMLAPILGGLLGEISWRLAFVLVAVVAVVLALPRQTLGTGVRQLVPNERASLGSLLNRWIALLAAQALLGYLGFTAIGFVLVLVGAEEFGLGSTARGLLIAGYGIGGILLGRYAGSVVDRAGRPATALAGAIACTAGVLGLVVAPSPWSLGLVFFGIGCASTFVWAGLNTIAVESFPREPRRRDFRLQRLQVRRGSDRAARLRSSLRRGHPAPVPPGRRLLGAPRRVDLPLVRALPMRRRVVVHGRVQGVFFRDTTRRLALEQGVSGWVRNNWEGTVEAVFEGPPWPSSASSSSLTADRAARWSNASTSSRRTRKARRSFSSADKEGSAKCSRCRRAALLAPRTVSSVAPVALAPSAPCVLASERPSHPDDERHSAKPSSGTSTASAE